MALPFTFDQLQAFILVLDTGSFSVAAEQLGVTQPAVSAQVRELERKAGLRLIERVGRTVAPTAAGTTLAGHARGLLDAGMQAAAAVSSHADGVQGTVRMGTGATACLHLLPALLRQIRSSHPALHVVVTTGNTDDIVRRVELNALDLGLVTLPVASRALTVSTALTDAFVAVSAVQAPALPRTVTPKNLADKPLILFEPGTNTRQRTEAWLLSGGVRARPTMELGSIEAIKQMVSAGLGCSILPAMALRDADRTALQVRPLRPALSRELGIIMRQDKPLVRGMQVLVAALLASAAQA
ncbi:LysR family transcriptional regulator [Acidovorax sp. SUPP1855]|uniref:LysR family transcriptional regulator n=1 Tax=Acidovorax sp. SUPP1855 TaxID=431774 RepID=UPI0023DE2158|nr:LysR family transcriptional regulator [Acidovorax sp. SUPP1855]GKS86934.1 LysR family transcriptional regulator [Acidovorax sp. SUPP1855]